METMFIDARYVEEIILSEENLSKLAGYKKISLFASIQFTQQLKAIKKQLEDKKISVISSQAARTNEKSQLLGCDVYYESLNLPEAPEAFLYIGDGDFHPRALVLAQKDNKEFKPVIKYDPIQQKITAFDFSSCKTIINNYKANLMKFLTAKNIGVVVSLKPGQQHYEQAKIFKEKYSDKNVYVFLDNTLNYSEFENFNFIELWINSACPRIGFDDSGERQLSMINMNDAMNAKELLSKDSLLTKR